MAAEFLAMFAVVALTVLVLLKDSGDLLFLLPVATFVLCVSPWWWWWFKKKRRPPPPAPAAHVFIVVAHDPVAHKTHEVRAFTTYELASAEFARLKGVYPPEMVMFVSWDVEG